MQYLNGSPMDHELISKRFKQFFNRYAILNTMCTEMQFWFRYSACFIKKEILENKQKVCVIFGCCRSLNVLNRLFFISLMMCLFSFCLNTYFSSEDK